MPHYFVKQPNGKYAIWSTISDTFLAIELTEEEAIHQEFADRTHQGYPGGDEALLSNLKSEIRHVNEIGRAWDWAMYWEECVKWLERTNNEEELDMIDGFNIPRRMKRPASSLKDARYWLAYWRSRARTAEQLLSQYDRMNMK